MDSDRFRDLAIEHILQGLGGTELEEFEGELLRRGEAGVRELDQLKETVASLGLGAAPVEPPPELRRRVLARIAKEGERGYTADVVALRAPTRRSLWVPATIAAAIVLALGLWNLRLREELRVANVALDSAQTRIEAADSIRLELDSFRQDLTTITSPVVTAITLAKTEAVPEGHARAFLDPATGRALIFFYELPILPPDSVYQLWAIKDRTPIDAGVFSVGPDRRARLEVAGPEDVLGADALAVTIEPAPGRPEPTGPIVLSS